VTYAAIIAENDLGCGLIAAAPLSDLKRPVIEGCPYHRCPHPAFCHNQRILGGIKGDRVACSTCVVEGGRCA
jgi:hypothetical protein